MNSLVSIIVITYNSEKYVIETLDSIRIQTYSNIELIISDDGSNDNTINILNNWIEIHKEKFRRILLVTSGVNTGISANANRGINAANGEWIKIIAADDALTTNCISSCMKFVNQNVSKEVYALHGIGRMYKNDFSENNFLFNRGNSEWCFNKLEISSNDQYKILLRICPIVTPTVFLKRSVFNVVGYFDEDLPFWEDRPMWLKITKAGFRFYFLDEELALYRMHPGSIQKAQNDQYFSNYLLSRDLGYRKYILPDLPLQEWLLNWYTITVRRAMVKLGLNKKSRGTDLFYRAVTFLVENYLNKLNLDFEK